MHDLPLLLGFIAAACVLTVTPGVDTAIVLRTTLAQGRAAAARAALGVGLGCLVWGGCVALGLVALLQASEAAYRMLQATGAAYLVWTGGRMLLRPRLAPEPADDTGSMQTAALAFRRGFLANLLNPKVGVFYVSFLPQFVPEGAGVGPYIFFLATLHVGLSLAWFGLLITLTAPLQGWLRRPAALRALDRLTGGILVAFGMKLAVSSAR